MGDFIKETQKRVWNWMEHATDSRPMTDAEKRAYQAQKNAPPAAEEGPLAKAMDKVSDIHMWLKTKAGWVPPTLDDTGKALSRVQVALAAASISSNFGLASAEMAQTIDQARQSLNPVQKLCAGVGKMVHDVDSALIIIDAARKLSTWANGGSTKPEDAAEAARNFDILFGALGHFCKKVPFLNTYAAIFEQIGKSGFFSAMRLKIDPYQPGGARADAMRQAWTADGSPPP